MNNNLILIIATSILGAVFGKLLAELDLLPHRIKKIIHLIAMAVAIIIIIYLSTQMMKQ
ncbi:MAG: hypothetical protein N2645_19510 [Clostridia bacterium]|nr:hypothetical protein [Clostridia bacterium]